MRALLLAAVAAAPVQAEDAWRVDPEASEIAFEYTENGRPARGAFRRIEGAGVFDARAPEEARLTLTIDVASIDLGDPLETAFVQSVDWFAAAEHPVARYELVRLEPEEPGRYTALGDLTIKGETRQIVSPVILEIGSERAAARGWVTFDRRGFGVGVGPTALLVSIGREVTVTFDLVARRRN